MRVRSALVAGILLCATILAIPQLAHAPALASAVRQALPSVCYLLVIRNGTSIIIGTATVVWSSPERSILLTARHIVDRATGADCIFLGGRSSEGGRLTVPPVRAAASIADDWALLDVKVGGLTPIPLTTQVDFGEPVIAITMAANIPFLTFRGSVARPVAPVPGEPDFGPVILLDMQSFSGASGALVLNARGEAVAIISHSYIVGRTITPREKDRQPYEFRERLVAIGVPLGPVIEALRAMTAPQPPAKPAEENP